MHESPRTLCSGRDGRGGLGLPCWGCGRRFFRDSRVFRYRRFFHSGFGGLGFRSGGFGGPGMMHGGFAGGRR
jgi:hypothetical protein